MNRFRQLLKSAGSHPPVGTWIMSASAIVAEAVGYAGFDFGVVDMEHSPLDLRDVVALLQAVCNTKMVPVVRVPWNEPVVVKRVLDAGATTVMFPFVQSAEEAARAVAATRYPPAGVRGVAGMSRATQYGTRADFMGASDREMGVIVQLETPQALDALAEIAAVPGVDALFIGPADLSAAMGYAGQSLHPQVLDRMTRAARLADGLGKPIGTLGGSAPAVAQYRAAGFHYVAVGADLSLMMQGARAALAALRGGEGESHVHTLAEGTLTGTSKTRA